MDDSTFWNIIDRFDWDRSGDDEAVLEPAVVALAAMDERAIFRFGDLLAEKLHALDTREHCRACYAGEIDPDDGDQYVSADAFLYDRCVVVANGREFYQAVLADPSKMPRDLEFESLLHLPPIAYERKTNGTYDHVSPVSYESFQNAAGWASTPATRPGKFTGSNVPPGNRRPADPPPPAKPWWKFW